jgi:signal transduction histidine kinase
MQKLESINRLTSGIAHDFNNLLMAIAGYNECNKFSAEDVLLESISREQVSTEFLENSKQIQIATDKAVRLIEKMLLYCRRDGGGEIHHPVLNLNEVLEENLKMLRSTIPTSINFERILVDQNLNLLNIDETYLSQIIVNLFVNAQDAINGNKKGTITLKTNVVEYAQLVCSCCQCNVDGRFVEITVADNGSGIDPAIAKRIFEPFFTTKQVGDGTGLGLSVIVGMVHNAGGHVLLESEVGVGSTFGLLFPIS